MKIMYVDTNMDGHHQAYLQELLKNESQESVIVLPEKAEWIAPSIKQYVYSPVNLCKKTIRSFRLWMKEVGQFAEIEKPDVIHLLTGDVYYKYFGLGLHYLSKYKTVMTLHWVRPGKVQRLSLKRFCGLVNKVVVHSDFLCGEVRTLGIKNAVHIEYPQFKQGESSDTSLAKKFWNLKQDIPVIASIGGTREDKGLDILLDALCELEVPFQLLIAGKEETFDKAYIEEKTKVYADKVTMVLRYLTDEEVDMAISAADIIAIPYRKSFNGASGPLGEGASKGKCIVGPNHGNLGHTIQTYHLGYTFETEDANDLARVLAQALVGKLEIDEKYKRYQSMLNPIFFRHFYKEIYEDMSRN